MQRDHYQDENQQLRKLHQQRLGGIVTQPQHPSQQSTLSPKRIVPLDDKPIPSKTSNPIYLNTIIYDKRSAQDKFNNITLASFMHPTLQGVHARPVSKEVEAIMMTNYGFQMQVFEPIANSGVPFFVFNRDGDSKEGKVLRNYQGIANMTVVSPPKHIPGYGVFHTKLWLIKFKAFLRVVVCTSNNHLYDWSVWQNAYWYHDCPLVEHAKQADKPAQVPDKGKNETSFDFQGDFLATLKWVVKSMQPLGFDILKEMKVSLEQYSYKGITAILIPSIPGRYKGQEMDGIGLGKIRKILKPLKSKFKQATLTANCTSLGKVDQKFIREVYFSFCPANTFMKPDRFKLVYPTDHYIKNETCGAAEVLFLMPQNYAKCELKKQIFYKYQQSTFNGVEGGIPHLKTIVVQQKPGQKVILYMGSHNLTKAAWGTFQKNESQINCMNEQLGLLFLDYPEQDLLQWLPYRYPPEKYAADDLPYLRKTP